MFPVATPVPLPVDVEPDAGGVWVPPFADVAAVDGVVVAGVVVVAVLAGVVGVEVVPGVVATGVLVVCPPLVPEPAELGPVEPPALALGLVGPRWSSVLLVEGLSAGVVLGTLSATVVPPQAASATAPKVAATSASGCPRRAFTARAEACAARTTGSR